MPRAFSPLRGKLAFDRAIRKADRKFRSNHFVLFATLSRKESMLGMLLAKKKLPRAVDRNKTKRQIRSGFDKLLRESDEALTLVFLLSAKVEKAKRPELGKEIKELFRKTAEIRWQER